jgi:hypothetical protein
LHDKATVGLSLKQRMEYKPSNLIGNVLHYMKMLKFHFIHDGIIYLDCPNKLNVLIFIMMMCMTQMETTITTQLKKKMADGSSTPKTSFCYTHSKLRFFKAIKVSINFVTLAC